MTMFPVTVSACCLCCLNDGCIPLWSLPSHPKPVWPLPPSTPDPASQLLISSDEFPSHLIQSRPIQSSPVQSIKQCFLCTQNSLPLCSSHKLKVLLVFSNGVSHFNGHNTAPFSPLLTYTVFKWSTWKEKSTIFKIWALCLYICRVYMTKVIESDQLPRLWLTRCNGWNIILGG